MLPHRLQRLRRLQLSTVLACYHKLVLPPGLPADYWEIPDDRRQWPAACEVMASLHNLQHAHITIFMMCQLERHDHATDAELLSDLLQPLKAIHASDFVVEVAMPLNTARERIGETPFRLLQRQFPVRSNPSYLALIANSSAETFLLTAMLIAGPFTIQGSRSLWHLMQFVEAIQCRLPTRTKYSKLPAVNPNSDPDQASRKFLQESPKAVAAARSARILVMKPSKAAGVCPYLISRGTSLLVGRVSLVRPLAVIHNGGCLLSNLTPSRRLMFRIKMAGELV
jgi:hypothetical protein